MQLFDTGPRTELRHKKDSESSFEYYNRSARPGISVLREILERWFERFPSEERKLSIMRNANREERWFDRASAAR